MSLGPRTWWRKMASASGRGWSSSATAWRSGGNLPALGTCASCAWLQRTYPKLLPGREITCYRGECLQEPWGIHWGIPCIVNFGEGRRELAGRLAGELVGACAGPPHPAPGPHIRGQYRAATWLGGRRLAGLSTPHVRRPTKRCFCSVIKCHMTCHI